MIADKSGKRVQGRLSAGARHRLPDLGAMNIHEYQAKALLKGYGAPVAEGVPSPRPMKPKPRPSRCRARSTS
jgi:hypothetical protein